MHLVRWLKIVFSGANPQASKKDNFMLSYEELQDKCKQLEQEYKQLYGDYLLVCKTNIILKKENEKLKKNLPKKQKEAFELQQQIESLSISFGGIRNGTAN